MATRFPTEELEGGPALREGQIGVLDHVDPEIRSEQLLALRMVAGVRAGHPLTAARFAAASHVVVSRRGRFTGPAGAALTDLDLKRRVVAVLPSHLAAMTLAVRTDVVCLVPATDRGHGWLRSAVRRAMSAAGQDSGWGTVMVSSSSGSPG